MKIYSAVKAAHLAARKARNKEDADALGSLISEMDRVATSTDSVLKIVPDDQAILIIRKMIKSLDALIVYNNVRAPIEKAMFEGFLPTQLTEAEIVDLIREARRTLGYDNLKQIMAHFKAHYAGLYSSEFLVKEVQYQLTPNSERT